MSLADRITHTSPAPSNHGCQTCRWWQHLDPQAQQLINDWITAGHSQQQLYYLLTSPDDDDPPLTVSLTGWRHHLKHHNERCR